MHLAQVDTLPLLVKKFLSASASARRLDVSRPRFEKIVRSGLLQPAGRLGSAPIFDEEDVMRFAGDLLSRQKLIQASRSSALSEGS